MAVALGIDVGGSTTKIVGFAQSGELIGTLQVRADDQITSLYGAVGCFLNANGIPLTDVARITLTGVGASLTGGDIYGIPTRRVDELRSVGYGGVRLAGLDEALVVSMGTGAAFVRVTRDGIRHIGGSGIGGGTLLGLASKLINESAFETVVALAENGDLANVDVSIQEITRAFSPHLPPHATASNFGKIKNSASKQDVALGLINMVLQTVGMLAVFACLDNPVKDIVLTGTLTVLPQARTLFPLMGSLYGVNFVIPENAVFATAIGAASCAVEN